MWGVGEVVVLVMGGVERIASSRGLKMVRWNSVYGFLIDF